MIDKIGSQWLIFSVLKRWDLKDRDKKLWDILVNEIQITDTVKYSDNWSFCKIYCES